MTDLNKLDIAVVGRDDQVALMRFAGVDRFEIIKDDDQDTPSKVKTAVETFMKDPAVGIILIPEEFGDYVEDLRYYLQEKRMTTPVIVEIPSGFEAEERDIKGYYQALTKRLIGFTIEL